MITSNISFGENVDVDPSAGLNNVKLGNDVLVRKMASVFGSPNHILEIGDGTKISMLCLINGFDAPLKIGNNCGISPKVQILTGSGPGASEKLQRAFPIVRKAVTIGNDCWIGTDTVIMPGVILGNFCIVAANSYVNKSFPDYSIIGGNPARLIRSFTEEEVRLVNDDK